jgi:hypothetical protein
MGGTPQGPYGKPPSGQPAAMQQGDFTPAARRPELFGQGQRAMFGVPKVIVIPSPKAGQEWLYTHSGPSFFVLVSGFLTFVTSAVVATRGVVLNLKYTGVTVGAYQAVFGQTATQTINYCIGPLGNSQNLSSTAPINTPADLIIKDGMSLGSGTALIDAGDQYSAIALYVYEFTDKCLELL